MRISARNVLKGTITDVEIGAVSGVVSIKVGETALTRSEEHTSELQSRI